MPAKSEVPKSNRDESILPISADFAEPGGGGAWIAAGVCALALAIFVSFKLKPVEARPPEEPAWASVPVAAPEPVAVAAKDELDARKATEQAMPLVNGAAQAEPAVEEKAAAAAPTPPQPEPAASAAPEQRARDAYLARKARREEQQRRGHEFTLALNLGTAPGQDAAKPAQAPIVEAPSTTSEQPAPVVMVAPAPKSPIPDNPY